ncbi:mitochondrial alternative oxidase [Rhizodiscina lignyota]|uniref:Alternative oxidase n=1 Tax=Rhizodiscina lignyota TaxID=1504668 RepID=A0A9P4IHW2_9PEZI|nr:mitochondrial alternative oxidase [Rhizodiscina lignyota]
MYSARQATHCRALASGKTASQVLKTLNGAASTSQIGFRPICISVQQHTTPSSQRNFSANTSVSRVKEYFPAPNAPGIRKTKAAWPHPFYNDEQMKQVEVAHRETRNFSDRVALFAVRILRWGLDTVSGYKHTKAVALNETDPEEAQRLYGMTEKKYLIRNVFLESVAGVPGMVAGMLRHLHSMRKMKRDNGWIETLLEESYNERMHLLIFLKMYEPGLFMRLMVLGAQGVFFNAMFVSYLISPRTCHRFVGYLEEEAVLTYSKEIEAIEGGRCPGWANMQAPQIAIDYYNMPEGHQSLKDMLYYIRADESKHREVNHTLGNLDQNEDPNPYTSEFTDPEKPHPRKDLQFQRPTGWERKDIV